MHAGERKEDRGRFDNVGRSYEVFRRHNSEHSFGRGLSLERAVAVESVAVHARLVALEGGHELETMKRKGREGEERSEGRGKQRRERFGQNEID